MGSRSAAPTRNPAHHRQIFFSLQPSGCSARFGDMSLRDGHQTLVLACLADKTPQFWVFDPYSDELRAIGLAVALSLFFCRSYSEVRRPPPYFDTMGAASTISRSTKQEQILGPYLDDVIRRGAADYLPQAVGPAFHCHRLLGVGGVAVIDACDAALAVVQKLAHD